MGLCGAKMSDEERAAMKRNRELDRNLNDAEQYDQALVKLLLLGAGESGKSTIFKQMRILYGDGFDDQTRRSMARVIISNLIGGTCTVLENAERLGHPMEGEAKAAEKILMDSKNIDQDTIPAEVAAAIKTLWFDENFQKVHDKRADYQLFSSYEDFAKSCAKKYPKWGGISPDGEAWIPSVGDVTKARVRTSGIVEEKYIIDGVEFRMFDVGGQRNERKKWIHCFDNVTAVIFVGAISEYDQVLYEDKSQNRLIEAFELFDEICNSKWFAETSIILFLNKKDLFEEKYITNRVPLDVTGLFGPECEMARSLQNYPPCVPVQEDAFDYDIAVEWIVKVFMARKNNDDKEVYHHITCATDPDNVSTVFNACKDIILKGNLKGSGFLE